MLNRVILIGRITNDLELQTASTGNKYLRFSLAINRPFNRDKTDFINCTAFGNIAENMSKYLSKGSMVNIEGSLQQSRYQTSGGDNVTSYNVVVERMNFIESRNQGNSRATNNAQPAQTVNVDNKVDRPVNAPSSSNGQTEENELRALFDDMDFFNE